MEKLITNILKLLVDQIYLLTLYEIDAAAPLSDEELMAIRNYSDSVDNGTKLTLIDKMLVVKKPIERMDFDGHMISEIRDRLSPFSQYMLVKENDSMFIDVCFGTFDTELITRINLEELISNRITLRSETTLIGVNNSVSKTLLSVDVPMGIIDNRLIVINIQTPNSVIKIMGFDPDDKERKLYETGPLSLYGVMRDQAEMPFKRGNYATYAALRRLKDKFQRAYVISEII